MSHIVLLARHGTHAEVGRVLSGRSEIGLSNAGHAEAEMLARHLMARPLSSIHSSPRRRTRETAAPIAQLSKLAVTIAPALDEIEFGRFSGRSFAALAGDPDWQRWNAERGTARCPEGESMAEAVTRAMTYLAALPEAQAPALCVTHCDVIRGIVARILGLGFERIFSFDCDPASLTTLLFDGSDVRLLSLNEHGWCGDTARSGASPTE